MGEIHVLIGSEAEGCRGRTIGKDARRIDIVNIHPQLVHEVGALGCDSLLRRRDGVRIKARNAAVPEVGCRIERVAKRGAVQREAVTPERFITLPHQGAHTGGKRARGRRHQTGHSHRCGLPSLHDRGAIEHLKPTERIGRVAVNDNQAPASIEAEVVASSQRGDAADAISTRRGGGH